MLGGVAKGLGEDRLREGLEPRRDAHGTLPGDAHARVLVFEAAKNAAEGELGLALGWDEPSFKRSAELAEDGPKLRAGAGAVFGGELALCAQDERQGEEALDDLLVELAGERHALVQAVGALALAGGAVDPGNECGSAAEGAKGRRSPSDSSDRAPSQSAKMTPSQRPPIATGIQAMASVATTEWKR